MSPPLASSMNAIFPIILVQVVLLTIQVDYGILEPVCDAADCLSKVRVAVVDIVVLGRKTENNIPALDIELLDDGSEWEKIEFLLGARKERTHRARFSQLNMRCDRRI